MKALILTAAAGNGHVAAARALETAFLRLGAEARAVDALDCAPRAFRVWFTGGYETLVRRWPWYWGRLYRWSDRPGLAYAFQTFLDDVMLTRLPRLIAQERPDVIVCTQALPLPRLARLKGELERVPVAVVITDVYPHRMWLRGSPDRYFVPLESTRAELERRLPGSAEKTEVTGIPIHEVFAEPISREEARLRLGMGRSERVVVLTSGGIGGGPLTLALAALIELPDLDRVFVVCGRNARAMAQCRAVVGRTGAAAAGERITILGHLAQSDFATLLRTSDLIVGKPGGLTMSETMALGKAMVIYEPLLIPGQEEGNAEYMQVCGCAVRARNAAELRSVVSRLMDDSSLRMHMEEAARVSARPHAARIIASRLIAYLR